MNIAGKPIREVLEFPEFRIAGFANCCHIVKQITTHVEIEMKGLCTFYRRKQYKEDVLYILSLIHTEKKEIFYFPGGPVVDSVLPLQGTQVQSLVGKVPYAMQKCHKEKRNEILPCATTWVNLEGIILSGISQRKTNTIVITYMWNLK